MTSSATLICLVWVHAFQVEVMGIDACSCWGHWQASASAGLVPRDCVTVAPVVTPGCGSASTLSPRLAVPCVWAPCLFWPLNTFLALGSGIKISKVLVQNFRDPYLISHTF